MVATELLKTLLECGVHFGHQTRRWNPKMKRFIFGERSGIYIIDLEKTQELLNVARDFVQTIAAKGGTLLFVGTKKQAKDVIKAEAERSGMPYIHNRWLGGLLTNFETVKKSLSKLYRLEKLTSEEEGSQKMTKKERMIMNKEKQRLIRDFDGMREMTQIPDAIFIVDSRREENAVLEANRLNIPVIALIDTNCDPDFIDYPVPGNDDALKSIRFITSYIADAILEGKKEFLDAENIRVKKTSENQTSEEKGEEDPGEKVASQT